MFNMNNDYTGYLIAAHPLRQNNFLNQGVVFIVENSKAHGTFGVQINHVVNNEFNLTYVMDQLGFSTTLVDDEVPIYKGGNLNLNRICLLHSNDWRGRTTIEFSSNINLTSDVSILEAISRNQGPSQYKAIMGNCFWAVDELESEVLSIDESNVHNSWVYTKSSKKLVFDSKDGRDQWCQVLKSAGELQITRWFS
jgi:putative transcriptional regulator